MTVDECAERERNPLKSAARIGLEIAERNAERALADLEKARERMRQADAVPKQPKPGSVIKFMVQRAAGEACRTYVAMRTHQNGGGWLVAGSAPTYTWSQIVHLMMEDEMNKREGTVSFYDFEKQKWQGRKP